MAVCSAFVSRSIWCQGVCPCYSESLPFGDFEALGEGSFCFVLVFLCSFLEIVVFLVDSYKVIVYIEDIRGMFLKQGSSRHDELQ